VYFQGFNNQQQLNQNQRQQNTDTMGEDVTAELLAKFNKFDSFRQQFDEEGIRDYKLYVGWKEELDEALKGKRSNLHIPRTYQILDTLRSRYVTTFFKSRPYGKFEPEPQDSTNPQSMKIEEEKADIASALVDMQLDKNEIIPTYYDYITEKLVFPAAIMSVGWRYEQDFIKKKVPVPEMVMNPRTGFPSFTGNYTHQVQQSQETIWDDNEIKIVDYFDFWPDPKANDFQNCRGVFHREFVTEEELYQRLEWLRQLGEGTLYPVDWKELRNAAGSLEKGRRERLSSIGYSSEQGKIYGNSDNKEDQKNAEYQLLHYWEKNRHAILVNKSQCVYDGPSPYWRHRELPFVFGSYEPMANEIYGKSAVSLIEDLQDEINTMHNQRIDNVSMIINKGFIRRKNADVPNSDLVVGPRTVIDVPDIHNDLKPLDFSDLPQSAYAQESLVGQEAENTLSAPPIVRGNEGRHSNTATTDMIKNDNASTRFEVKIKVNETKEIKRMFRLMDMNNQQFVDSDRLIRLGPESSVQWRKITPGDLIGERDYKPVGTTTDPGANKEIRREQLSDLLQNLIQFTQFTTSLGMPPMVKFQEVIREYLDTFDMSNPQRFLVQKDELMQQLGAMQNILPQLGGGQPGAGQQQQPGSPGGQRRMGQPQQRIPAQGVMSNTPQQP
jgi:hypothetical protein